MLVKCELKININLKNEKSLEKGKGDKVFKNLGNCWGSPKKSKKWKINCLNLNKNLLKWIKNK